MKLVKLGEKSIFAHLSFHQIMPAVQELQQIATQLRRDIVRMVHGAKSGHPGGSLGCADFFAALYFQVMHHQPKPFNMEGKNEDVFILSNGHISPVFYSALARSGYFPVKELATFRSIDSRLQGHPATAEHLEGVRIATGSLGQGLSVASGIALEQKSSMAKPTWYMPCWAMVSYRKARTGKPLCMLPITRWTT